MYRSTKQITHDVYKLKVVMIIDDKSFFFRFENKYFYIKHHNRLRINSFDDAYRLFYEQHNFSIDIYPTELLSDVSSLKNAMRKLNRELKLKELL